jgi:Fe2+ or Zn2+ uptake regulation protein
MDVYQALAAVKSHPTAEQLHRMIQAATPGISLATVYNTLEALINAGLVRKLAMRDGPARYDADVSNHLHVTTTSGEVMDLPEDLSREVMNALASDLRDRIESRLGASVEHLSVEFLGQPRSATSRA